MQLTFRAARLDDVDDIVQLVESAYRGEVSRAGWTTEADLLEGQRTDCDEVRALISDPSVVLVLASLGAELVASVMVRAKATATSHIGMFAVKPAKQSRGLGRALLAEAERVALEEQGSTSTEMTVIEQRLELIAWYGRRGYRPTGGTEPFPYGNPRFGLPLRDDLRFVILVKSLPGAGA